MKNVFMFGTIAYKNFFFSSKLNFCSKHFFSSNKKFLNSQKPGSQLHWHLSTSNMIFIKFTFTYSHSSFVLSNLNNFFSNRHFFCFFWYKLKMFHKISRKISINIKFKQQKTNVLSFKTMTNKNFFLLIH